MTGARLSVLVQTTVVALVLSTSALSAQSAAQAMPAALTAPSSGIAFSSPGSEHPRVSNTIDLMPEFWLARNTPTPRFPDPHDANYAKRGAIIGAVTTGVATAVIMGLFAKRDCEPGLCGTEFQRGALVGAGVGLAAGGVLGWLIGAEVERK